jgi:Rrf2 family iron-sulfur cluster assembly transcriptional regulator
MRFTRTTEYALRTLAFMAQGEKRPHSSRALHRQLGIPQKYLQRLLTDLTKHRLINSTRGRAGGYFITRSLRKITLLEIVEAVEGFERDPRCFFGFSSCPLENPCVMHERWRKQHHALLRLLAATRLADLVAGPKD